MTDTNEKKQKRFKQLPIQLALVSIILVCVLWISREQSLEALVAMLSAVVSILTSRSNLI